MTTKKIPNTYSKYLNIQSCEECVTECEYVEC